jgi:hypothetical protein
MATKHNESETALSARVIVEAQTPAGVDWPVALRLLRSYDLPKERRELSAERAAQVLGERLSADVLDKMRSLQRSVWLIDQQRSTQPALAKHKKSSLSAAEIAQRIVKYLKTHGAGRVNIPRREPSKNGEYLSELFRALSQVVGKTQFTAVMQKISPGAPLPALKESLKKPDEVLRRLLPAAPISARLTFDEKDGALVMYVTPLDRVAALLLRVLEVKTQKRAAWATCEWCTNPYSKTRRNERGCSPRCKNNLRMRDYRARKALQQKKAQRRKHHG